MVYASYGQNFTYVGRTIASREVLYLRKRARQAHCHIFSANTFQTAVVYIIIHAMLKGSSFLCVCVSLDTSHIPATGRPKTRNLDETCLDSLGKLN